MGVLLKDCTLPAQESNNKGLWANTQTVASLSLRDPNTPLLRYILYTLNDARIYYVPCLNYTRKPDVT